MLPAGRPCPPTLSRSRCSSSQQAAVGRRRQRLHPAAASWTSTSQPCGAASGFATRESPTSAPRIRSRPSSTHSAVVPALPAPAPALRAVRVASVDDGCSGSCGCPTELMVQCSSDLQSLLEYTLQCEQHRCVVGARHERFCGGNDCNWRVTPIAAATRRAPSVPAEWTTAAAEFALLRQPELRGLEVRRLASLTATTSSAATTAAAVVALAAPALPATRE